MSAARLLVLAVAFAAARSLAAQDARIDPRLEHRLDARTSASVGALVDSARAERLPAEPLVQKALEGASKHADGARIVAAVRALMLELRDARAVLGASASDAEVAAGASALHVGISRATIERLRDAHSRASLTVTLAVLTDLVARGVPGDTAAVAVSSLAAAGARDAELLAYRQGVERDISLGAPPAAAATIRARPRSR